MGDSIGECNSVLSVVVCLTEDEDPAEEGNDETYETGEYDYDPDGSAAPAPKVALDRTVDRAGKIDLCIYLTIANHII